MNANSFLRRRPGIPTLCFGRKETVPSKSGVGDSLSDAEELKSRFFTPLSSSGTPLVPRVQTQQYTSITLKSVGIRKQGRKTPQVCLGIPQKIHVKIGGPDKSYSK